MTDDIVARLKKYLDGRPGVGGRTFDPLHPEILIAESADEIERLREMKARLLSALRVMDERAALAGEKTND